VPTGSSLVLLRLVSAERTGTFAVATRLGECGKNRSRCQTGCTRSLESLLHTPRSDEIRRTLMEIQFLNVDS